MKLVREVLKWCEGAQAELGDAAAPICQVFARCVAALGAAPEEVVFTASQQWIETPIARAYGGELLLYLFPASEPLPIPVVTGEPVVDEEGLIAFGVKQIASGLWHLEPSLNAPGLIHAFVVLYDVPDPAPWDRRIILPG